MLQYDRKKKDFSSVLLKHGERSVTGIKLYEFQPIDQKKKALFFNVFEFIFKFEKSLLIL